MNTLPTTRVATAIAAAISTLGTAVAADPELEALKVQLQNQIESQIIAMKERYEGRIQKLEERINTLEGDNARLKKDINAPATERSKTASSAEIASMKKRINELEVSAAKPSPEVAKTSKRAQENAAAIATIQQKLQDDATESRDIYREGGDFPFDLKKFYDLPSPFEFHGYLRSGFGMNGEGGKMVDFIAPGAGAKYRLGNEKETYGELGLTHNWLRADDPMQAPYVRSTVMLSYSTGENFSYDSLNNQAQGNDIALRQAYVEGGNIFPSAPDIRFWAGQRYYRRHDIYINDFYFLDMSGYGGGVEDVKLGDFGKLALAWIGGSVDNYVTDNGSVAKQSIDLRVYDIDVLLGKLTLWFDYATTKGGDVRNVANIDGSQLSLDSSKGVAVGFIHRTAEKAFLGGYNELSVQYGNGAAYNFLSELGSSGPDLDSAWRFRVTDHFTIQPSPHFAMQAVGLYQKTNYGGPNSTEEWASVGMRPVYFFNDRFSIALETGVDWVKSEPLGTEGYLWKITLAPQISRGDKFFSRPQLRAFVTYAKWSDGFEGKVGGSAYENATEGLSYGVQVEAWW